MTVDGNGSISEFAGPRLLQCTLVIPQNSTNNSILLAKKARGMGIGKWIGFGGKVETGETITAAALREFREETGVAIRPCDLLKIGLLLFSFARKPHFFLEVHVYTTFVVQDLPTLCDEFCGRAVWFARDEIPFKEMWEDFSHWSPHLFGGERFCARFHYDETDSVSNFNISNVEDAFDPILAKPAWMFDTTGAEFPWL